MLLSCYRHRSHGICSRTPGVIAVRDEEPRMMGDPILYTLSERIADLFGDLGRPFSPWTLRILCQDFVSRPVLKATGRRSDGLSGLLNPHRVFSSPLYRAVKKATRLEDGWCPACCYKFS